MTDCLRLEIDYPYLSSVSVNSCYNGANKRRGLKPEVVAWKDGLTLTVKSELMRFDRDFRSPVQVMFVLHAPKRTRVVDSGNFAKAMIDAIFDALPFDDNDRHLIRGPYGGVRMADQDKGFFRIILKEVISMASCFPEDCDIVETPYEF